MQSKLCYFQKKKGIEPVRKARKIDASILVAFPIFQSPSGRPRYLILWQNLLILLM